DQALVFAQLASLHRKMMSTSPIDVDPSSLSRQVEARERHLRALKNQTRAMGASVDSLAKLVALSRGITNVIDAGNAIDGGRIPEDEDLLCVVSFVSDMDEVRRRSPADDIGGGMARQRAEWMGWIADRRQHQADAWGSVATVLTDQGLHAS